MAVLKKLPIRTLVFSTIFLLMLAGIAPLSYALPRNNDYASAYRQMCVTNEKLKILGGEVQRAIADLSRKEEEIIDNSEKIDR
ncbi:MAG: hypothetical protein IBX64_00355 [Actinobacteria bacterium]|nr:hypothetical protein [Actinomycetota bacterium]